MKRIGFGIRIKPEMAGEYKEWHTKVWPELLDALRKHGWRNYSIFFKPDGQLFGYVEVEESFEASLAGMAGEEINQKWQDMMSPYFQLPEGAHADENMIEWEEVFHTD